MERLDLYVELSADCNAVGSATWECLGHHVTFSIYGPDETKVNEELTHRAVVNVTVTPPSGQHTLRETELESFLTSVIERLIDVKEFPRTKFSGRLCIVSGETSDPRTVAAALNAASLALLQSGLPLRATITAVCIPLGLSAMTLAIDVSHLILHRQREPLNTTDAGSIFAVYTGQSVTPSKQAVTATDKPVGFSPSEALRLFNPDPNSESDPQSPVALYRKQALDLADVMITQLASSKIV